MKAIGIGLLALTLASLASAAQDFAGAIVPLQIKTTTGRSDPAIGVSAGSDGVVVACSSLKDAASVTQVTPAKSTPLALGAARLIDNLCVLTSTNATSAPFAKRAAVAPGVPLIAVVPDPVVAEGYRRVDAVVWRKEEGGRGRVLFVATKSSGTSLEGAALFTGDTEFVGVSSAVPGSKDEYATLLLESPDAVRAIEKSFQRPEGLPKGQTRSGPLTPMLASGTETIGASFSYLSLATYYGRTRDYEKSVALAEKWKAQDPENPAAWLVEAGALRRLNFTEAALAGVERALKLNPDFVPALGAKVALLGKMGRVTEAEIAASKLAGSVRPTDGIDEAAMVGFLAIAKRVDEARERARSLHKKEPSASYAQNAACLVELMPGGSVDSAIDTCRALAEQSPESVSSWVQLSHAYLRKYRYDDAVAAAKRALAISVEVAEAWSVLGMASEAKGDVAAGSEAEQRITEYDSKLLESYKKGRSVATCVRQMMEKAYGLAVSSCETATRLNDRNAMAFAGLGAALMREKRIDEGIAAHERAITLDPKIKGSWSDLAIAYAQKRDVTKAKLALEKLAALDKPAADALAGRLRITL